jgi:hypothetical protein
MSWYGTHPDFSKAMIRSLLPPSPCKHCVYWFRTAIGSSPSDWHREGELCSRCGLPQWELLAQLNELLLGAGVQEQAELPRHFPASQLEKPKSPPLPESENDLERAIRLYHSPNTTIAIRAAAHLVQQADAPLSVLLDILDRFALAGLGAQTQKALLKRQDADLIPAMIWRTTSPLDFTREVACTVLGRCNDRSATPALLEAIWDRAWTVRRAAAFAIIDMNDVDAIPLLKLKWLQHRDGPTEEVWALKLAIQSLGIEIDKD